MKSETRLLSMSLMFLLSTAVLGANAYGSSHDEWIDTFNLEECDLSPTGANDYFILKPGHQLVLEGEEDGEVVELIITVLDETKTVDSVETRIVEERESEGGEIIEVSRNYFAVCTQTNDIFYFGEDVDNYEDGVIVNHDGSWLAGENEARAGLIMPGTPEVGFKYYQEVAPGIAEDRAEIISLDEVVEMPAGEFDNVLKTEEGTPLEPGVQEFKLYAPGIGLIQDADLMLASYTLADEVEEDEDDQESDRAAGKPMERRKEIVARENGRDIHERHMRAEPRSVGDYAPGLDYTLEAAGVATGGMQDSDVALTMDASVWKSNGAVVIMDVVGGTVTLGEQEYEIKLGYALYALYSLNHDVFRSSALVESDDGDVFTLRLRGVAATGAELPTSGGATIELVFEGNAHQMNSLDEGNLLLEGTLLRA